MTADIIRKLYNYSFWAHRRVWTCVEQLTDDQFYRPLDYSIGSIHAQVVHTMSAEYVWFSRLRGESPTGMLNPADYPTREDVRQRWDEVEAMAHDYLLGLGDATLATDLHYKTTKGTPQTTSIWGILLHLINHGTDHRAQTLAMMHVVGGPSIDQDLIVYLRDN